MQHARAFFVLCATVLLAAPPADAQDIVRQMTVGDSVEISIATLAWRKATNERVREYVAILTKDYAAHLAMTLTLVDSTSPQPAALGETPETSRARALLAALDSMPAGPAWDASFLRSQVARAQGQIDQLKNEMRAATSSALIDHLKTTIVLRMKHRDIARSLATTLGVALR